MKYWLFLTGAILLFAAGFLLGNRRSETVSPVSDQEGNRDRDSPERVEIWASTATPSVIPAALLLKTESGRYFAWVDLPADRYKSEFPVSGRWVSEGDGFRLCFPFYDVDFLPSGPNQVTMSNSGSAKKWILMKRGVWETKSSMLDTFDCGYPVEVFSILDQ